MIVSLETFYLIGNFWGTFRQRSNHSAQSSEGEGGEGHASENRRAAVQRRATATAGAQWTPSSWTHQHRCWQGHPAATGLLKWSVRISAAGLFTPQK